MTDAQKLLRQEEKKAKQREKEGQEKKLHYNIEYILDLFGIEFKKEPKLENSDHRLDYEIVNEGKTKIAIALQGGVWSGGRHITPAGYIEDRTKYNIAILEGWQVFELTTDHINAMLSWEKIDSRIYKVTKSVLDYCKKKQGGE